MSACISGEDQLRDLLRAHGVTTKFIVFVHRRRRSPIDGGLLLQTVVSMRAHQRKPFLVHTAPYIAEASARIILEEHYKRVATVRQQHGERVCIFRVSDYRVGSD